VALTSVRMKKDNNISWLSAFMNSFLFYFFETESFSKLTVLSLSCVLESPTVFTGIFSQGT
jgi:hypothetical protein